MTRREWLQSGLAAGAIPNAADDPDREIFRRVNDLRVLRGTQALAWSESVAACARRQNDRREALRFPGHSDPERGDVAARLNAARVKWSTCGENLFRENGYDDAVPFAIVFWWYSPGHQGNLLNPVYTETGIAVTRGADGTWFVTQIFIAPL
jgi:uncharacterized protein YkwD